MPVVALLLLAACGVLLFVELIQAPRPLVAVALVLEVSGILWALSAHGGQVVRIG